MLDQVEVVEDRGLRSRPSAQFAIQAARRDTTAAALRQWPEAPPTTSPILGPKSSRWLRRLGDKLQTVLP
jgi:hypothetical protein